MSLRLVMAAAAACALSGACGKGVPADPDAGDVDSAGIDARPAPPLQITPETPRTADDLVALASGDITGYSFRWSRNGAVRADLTTNMVAAANTTKGEVWRVELVDEGGGVGAFDEVTIANTPPTSPVISVPSSIVAGGTIQCVIDVASTDDDGDTVTYSVAWTENGVSYPGATTTVLAGDTVPTADTQQSDVFVCTVTPNDGEDDGPPAVSAASSVTCTTPTATTFAFTGAMQTYTVPCGVTQLRIEAWGAQGGGSAGGAGGYVRGELAVTQGQTLNVFVGGRNGFNGGGTGLHNSDPPHGGGASDVRIGGTDLANRVIVAGGGGGGRAGGEGTFPGGAGGGGTCGAGYCGGAGGTGWNSNHGGAGGASGGAGTNCDHCGGAGGAGLQSGGGAACEQYYQPSTCGTSGVLGVGGNGGPVTNAVCLDTYAGTSGGGGGYYGGGGSSVGFCGGGGGGGGSSWTGTLANPVLTGGARSGDGMIVLTPI